MVGVICFRVLPEVEKEEQRGRNRELTRKTKEKDEFSGASGKKKRGEGKKRGEFSERERNGLCGSKKGEKGK